MIDKPTLAAGMAIAGAAAPAFGPTGILALTVAQALLAAYVAATENGVDVTDQHIADQLTADEAIKASDLMAQIARAALDASRMKIPSPVPPRSAA